VSAQPIFSTMRTRRTTEIAAHHSGEVIVLDVVCFCHLRWSSVYQRPQHLLTRLAQQGAVHVWEEPTFASCDMPALSVSSPVEGLHVLTPTLPYGLTGEAAVAVAQQQLLDDYIEEKGLDNFVAWYYTPMALRFSDHLSPSVVVYDCMDELSAFQGAPASLIEEEGRLFGLADVVFAGGASLFASKRSQHNNVHLFPSSVDRDHFAKARLTQSDPADQKSIPHPRIGFYGVLDERLDIALLRDTAALRPDWHFILIGPVVKIGQDELPRAANIHYLGQKTYTELPAYLSGWDVAMLPFAQNASTRFISPTKTPEYLAGGKPVVSTPIRDVVSPYGKLGLVHIAQSPTEFIGAIASGLERGQDTRWLSQVDRYLADLSWDKTFKGMAEQIEYCRKKTHRSISLQGAAKGVEANV
jgi:glycosyltransferase involved in cell wall biosynthesis